MFKHIYRNVRYALTAIFLIGGYYLYAQAPVENSSATDVNVKVQNHKKLAVFHYKSRWQKFKRQVHTTEHPGESIHKKKHRGGRQWQRKEYHVFKRQNHSTESVNNTRSRQRNSKKYSSHRN